MTFINDARAQTILLVLLYHYRNGRWAAQVHPSLADLQHQHN